MAIVNELEQAEATAAFGVLARYFNNLRAENVRLTGEVAALTEARDKLERANDSQGQARG